MTYFVALLSAADTLLLPAYPCSNLYNLYTALGTQVLCGIRAATGTWGQEEATFAENTGVCSRLLIPPALAGLLGMSWMGFISFSQTFLGLEHRIEDPIL